MRIHTSATARVWLQRSLLAVMGVALVVTGLQATGNAVAKVDMADGTVWLVNPPTGTVVQVSAASEQVTATVRVANPNDVLSAAQDGHAALVLNRTTGELGRVEGTTLAYGHRQSLPGSSADLQLVVGGERAYVVDTNVGAVRSLRNDDLSLVAEIAVASGPRTAAADLKGNLWAASQVDGTLDLVRADESKASTTTLGGPGAALTLVNDRPVLADPSHSKTVVVNQHSGRSDSSTCLSLEQNESMLLAGSGPADRGRLLFALAPTTGQLITVDLAAGRCATLAIDEDGTPGTAGDAAQAAYGRPVANKGLLFIPVLARGQVLVVDTAENRIVRTIDKKELFAHPAGAGSDKAVAAQPFELILDDGNVWFNNLAGPEAGILDRDGVALSVLKYEAVRAGSAGGDAGNGVAVGADGEGIGVNKDPNAGVVGNRTDPLKTAEKGSAGAGLPGKGGSPNGNGDPGGASGAAGRGGGIGLPITPSAIPQPDTAALVVVPPGQSDAPRPITIPLPDAPLDNRVPAPNAPGLPSAPIQPAPKTETPLPSLPPPPTTVGGRLRATFDFGPATARIGDAVTFKGRTTGGSAPATGWQWDFGDGTSDRTQNTTHVYKAAGTFAITLTASNSQESDTSLPAIVTVVDPAAQQPPVANFVFSPASAEVGQAIVFRDQSLGTVNEWTWNWGDSTTSTGPNPTHAWSQPNTYRVVLTVRNQYGSTEAVRTITVVDKLVVPRASFVVSPSNPVAGDAVTFTDTSTGGPSAWAWDFGDGTSSNSQNISHRYARQGSYTVRLVAANAKGTSDPAVQTVVVGSSAQPLRAGFTATRLLTEIDQLVVFSDNSTGNPTSFHWTFGDGGTADGPSANHAWSSQGTYTVTLVISNAAGDQDRASVSVVVAPRVTTPIKADFSVRPGRTRDDAASVGQPVDFRDQSSPKVTSWEWDFGDGTPKATGRNVSHSYLRGGTFTAKLKVSDGTQTDTAARDVYVLGPASEPPVADFTYTPKAPLMGAAVAFTDQSRNASSWRWDFGDNTSSTAQSPSHTFGSAGTFNVTLTVRDTTGQSATKSTPVVVSPVARPAPAPVLDIRPGPDARFAGTPITFEDRTVGGAVTTPQFTFPTTTLSPPPGSRNVQYTFAKAGVQDVSMRVCWQDDPSNCGVVTVQVNVLEAVAPPVARYDLSGALTSQEPWVAAVGSELVFTDRSEGTGITTEWKIDNKTYPAGTKVVTYTAAAPGKVTFTLTVTNSAGRNVANGVVELVNPTPPAAQFEAPATSQLGRTVQFTDTSGGYVTEWRWEFGDGQTSTEKDPKHTYSTPNSYTVSLRVANRFGESGVFTKTIVISPAGAGPTPSIRALSPRDIPGNGRVLAVRRSTQIVLTDASADPGVDAWQWDFGDGGRASGRTVTHEWAEPGSYTMVLSAISARGTGVDSISVRVT